MPYQIDRDELKTAIDFIVDWVESQPVPEDAAEAAIAEGPEVVEMIYVAWLAACLTYGVRTIIIEHLGEFIVPV